MIIEKNKMINKAFFRMILQELEEARIFSNKYKDKVT